MTAILEFEEMLALGIDDCGLLLEECPGPPRVKPWGHGRPCTRDVSGTQLASGSSALTRDVRPTATQRTYGHGGAYLSAKAHAPSREQQVTITSKAIQMARAT